MSANDNEDDPMNSMTPTNPAPAPAIPARDPHPVNFLGMQSVCGNCSYPLDDGNPLRQLSKPFCYVCAAMYAAARRQSGLHRAQIEWMAEREKEKQANRGGESSGAAGSDLQGK